jgi:hypothetical protein
VLSVAGKGVPLSASGMGQEGERKRTTDEASKRYRWDELGGYPFTAQVVSGVKVARAWSGLRYGTWEPALRYCGQRNELRAHWSQEREAQMVEAMRVGVAMRGAGADCLVVAVKPGNAGGATGAGRPGSLEGQP